MALMLLWPSKWLKQIIQIKRNGLKAAQLKPKANQLAIYEGGKGGV